MPAQALVALERERRLGFLIGRQAVEELAAAFCIVAADFCDAMMAAPVHAVIRAAATASLSAVSRLMEASGKRITNNEEQNEKDSVSSLLYSRILLESDAHAEVKAGVARLAIGRRRATG